jgi:hypothetical protein
MLLRAGVARSAAAPVRYGSARMPQPIHARAEGVDRTPAFAEDFHEGQRGTVVFKTFNEGKELPNGKTEQWIIDPGNASSTSAAARDDRLNETVGAR